MVSTVCWPVSAHMWASYSGSAVCRSSLADQEFNNIQVVVMDGHMKRCQTVLLNTHAHTHIYKCRNTHTQNTQKHLYMKHKTWSSINQLISPNHLYSFQVQVLRFAAGTLCPSGMWTTEEHRLSHLPSCVRIGSSLQEELCHIHLSIFRGHMEGSEAFLLRRKKITHREQLIQSLLLNDTKTTNEILSDLGGAIWRF